MGKHDVTGLFEDIEHGYPVLAGGFHADLRAVVLLKPRRKLPQPLGESRKTGFVVSGYAVIVRNANAGKDKILVNVETATVVENDFEHGVPPARIFAGPAGTGRPENRVDFKEISLRAVSLRQTLIPLQTTDTI
jgi:hypothetical protein